MPRYNVEHNRKWACFSSIENIFVTKFSDKESHEMWRETEYGWARYVPAEKCNRMTMETAVLYIAMGRTESEAIKELLKTGVGEEEAIALIERFGSKRED